MVCKKRAVSPLKSSDRHMEMGTFDSSACADPDNFVKGWGSGSDPKFRRFVFVCVFFVVVFNFSRHLNKHSGPPLARQRNAIWMAFRCRADESPTLSTPVNL